jgi:hypothetical protein
MCEIKTGMACCGAVWTGPFCLTPRAGTLPFLSVEDSMSLNHAMTNHEARPHLTESYRGICSPAFDQLLYTDNEDYRALRWLMEKGIDLRGFRLVSGGKKGSGVILARLKGSHALTQETESELDIAEYYAERGRLQDLDETVGAGGCTALYIACQDDGIEVARALISAGADVDKALDDGYTLLYVASSGGHMEVVRALIWAKADVDKGGSGGCWTSLHVASLRGRIEVVRALIWAGADKDNPMKDDARTPPGACPGPWSSRGSTSPRGR